MFDESEEQGSGERVVGCINIPSTKKGENKKLKNREKE